MSSLARHAQPIVSRQTNSGRSLIELMVALAIGFVVVSSVLLTASGTNLSGQGSDTQSRLNEDAQIVLSILVPQIRMAGYSTVRTSDDNGAPYTRFTGPGIRGCDNGFANITTAGTWSVETAATYSTMLACRTTVNGATAISVLYEGDQFNTLPVGTAPTDCLGAPVNATPSALGDTVNVVENRYFLSSRSGGTWTLNCRAGITTQPLISNIEVLNLTYGVNTTTTPDEFGNPQIGTNVLRYMTATEIDGEATFNGDPADRWKRVVTARICLIMRSERAEAGQAAPYRDCTGTLQNGTDRFVRKVVFATVALRNRASAVGLTPPTPPAAP